MPRTTRPDLSSSLMRQLIEKLHEYGVDDLIDLPQLAVMGDTSSGKSSVLTALSGIEFPSNAQITTRCATQLILKNSKKFAGEAFLRRYGKDNSMDFWEKLSSLAEVKDKIQEMTGKLVQEGHEISDDSIVIRVSAPGVPNLTLTDLPGYIRTVGDNEDKLIIPKVRTLVQRYLKQSRTMILAIHPANVDIHNSEILQAALEIDPEGTRTMAIITKVDMVDRGAEDAVVNLVNNRVKELRLGYHAVKCRSQQDLKDGVSVSDAIKSEELFFETSEHWVQVEQDLLGIPRLAEKLVGHMNDRIREALPGIRGDLKRKREDVTSNLDKMGPELDDSSKRRHFFECVKHRLEMLLQMGVDGRSYSTYDFFSDYERRLRVTINGLDSAFALDIGNLQFPKKDELKKGDKVEVRVNGTWIGGELVDRKSDGKYECKYIYRDGEVRDKLVFGESDVRIPILWLVDKLAKERGREPPIFLAPSVFNSVFAQSISEWKNAMFKLAEDYRANLEAFIDEMLAEVCSAKAAKRLHDHLKHLFNSIITESYSITKAQLRHCYDMETMPFTQNHYLYETIYKDRWESIFDALKPLASHEGKVTLSALQKFSGTGTLSNDEMLANDCLCALRAYTKVARKRFTDNVPNILNHHLLNAVLDRARTEMLMTDEKLWELFQEHGSVAKKREELKRALEKLEKAEKEISTLLNCLCKSTPKAQMFTPAENSDVDSNFTCTICYQPLFDPVEDNCPAPHVFCRDCVDTWRSTDTGHSCPQSRLPWKFRPTSLAVKGHCGTFRGKCSRCDWEGVASSYETHEASCMPELERWFQPEVNFDCTASDINNLLPHEFKSAVDDPELIYDATEVGNFAAKYVCYRPLSAYIRFFFKPAFTALLPTDHNTDHDYLVFIYRASDMKLSVVSIRLMPVPLSESELPVDFGPALTSFVNRFGIPGGTRSLEHYNDDGVGEWDTDGHWGYKARLAERNDGGPGVIVHFDFVNPNIIPKNGFGYGKD
ncbi:hypothetical protein BJ742DRAFT_741752 [Cladochytrium replicatum]|nr:hypothetical protein BJ742DRAFT_741752 [Cladochytrium replicatum]